MCIYIYICNVQVCIFIFMSISTSLSRPICVSIYLSIYIYLYIYTYIHTNMAYLLLNSPSILPTSPPAADGGTCSVVLEGSDGAAHMLSAEELLELGWCRGAWDFGKRTMENGDNLWKIPCKWMVMELWSSRCLYVYIYILLGYPVKTV